MENGKLESKTKGYPINIEDCALTIMKDMRLARFIHCGKCNAWLLLRIIISSLVILFISLGFFGIGNSVFLALSKLQFGQFFLSLSARAVVVCSIIVVFSALFGRIYCSTLCPLGALQDFAGALGSSVTKRKYSFHRNQKLLRYAVFIFVALLFVLGVPALIGILDPYSIYVRGASRLLDRTVGFTMEIIDPVLRNWGVYSSYSQGSFHFMPVAILIVIFASSFLRGRLFCNTLCPVGMILGCASQAPVFRLAFKGNCVSCGKCEAVCKAECINVQNKQIDSSRCVMCGNCATACPAGAISYSKIIHKYNNEKRASIKSIASIAFFSALPLIKNRNFLSHIPALSAYSKKIVESNLHPQIPAGAMSWARLRDRCIGCHACIKRCPSKVLEPASAKYGFNGILKPVLNFNKGFCQYDCIVCGHTCPFGAIMPIEINEKHKIQTGIAHYKKELCVITTNNERCGACAEHCPTGALEINSTGINNDPIPTINSALCVGCGACEYICPVIPQKAITVRPHAIHQTAEVLQMKDNNTLEINEGFVF